MSQELWDEGNERVHGRKGVFTMRNRVPLGGGGGEKPTRGKYIIFLSGKSGNCCPRKKKKFDRAGEAGLTESESSFTVGRAIFVGKSNQKVVINRTSLFVPSAMTLERTTREPWFKSSMGATSYGMGVALARGGGDQEEKGGRGEVGQLKEGGMHTQRFSQKGETFAGGGFHVCGGGKYSQVESLLKGGAAEATGTRQADTARE